MIVTIRADPAFRLRCAVHALRGAALATSFLALACGGADAPGRSGTAGDTANAEWDIATGPFVFQSNVDGNADVFVAVGPEGGARRVTADPAFDGFANWDPDGRRIAFDSNRSGNENRDIWVVDSVGGVPRRLTDHPGFDFVPAWSPDGQWIAFVSTRDSEYDPVARNVEAFRGEIYRIRPDGSGLARLTDDPAHDQAPGWTADGTRIAWCRDNAGQGDIWVMNADGTDPRPLVTTPDFECTPRYSPDGRRLAWRTSRGDSSWIITGNADASAPVRLELPFASVAEPAWSPDSRWICFTAIHPDGDLDVLAIPAAGGTPVLMAGGPGRQQACAWRPAISPAR